MQKRAATSGRLSEEELEERLDTFPASDAPTATQPVDRARPRKR
jgi:hypothetical protein